MIYIACAALLLITASTACTESAVQTETALYDSYRDIPGVTNAEIIAIEELKQQTGSFLYGMPLSVEAFPDENGSIRGYTGLLCEWLTGLFGIKFQPALYEWNELFAGLANGTIDFTGELTVTPEREQMYYMTDPIAGRAIKYFRLADSKPFAEITALRPLRYAFMTGTNISTMVESQLAEGTFTVVMLSDMNNVYDLLKSETIDAFFYTNTAEEYFSQYSDIISRDFFPLIYRNVSLSAQNPLLQPVISVVQKALRSGATRHLADLYIAGYREYLKKELASQFTPEELAYMESHPVVPLLAENENYPVSFYNEHEERWQGAAIDILHEIEAITGLSFEVVNDHFTGWTVLLKMLEDGKAPIITDSSRAENGKARFLRPNTPILTDSYALISTSDHRNVDIRDILYLKTGVIESTAAAETFRAWFPEHDNTIIYKNYDDAFEALENGAIDLVMTTGARLLMMTNYRELTGYKINVAFDSPVYVAFGFNKEETVLCSIIDKALKYVDTHVISQQWLHMTYDYRSKLARMQLPWFIGAAILLLCVLILLAAFFFTNRTEGKRLEGLVHKRTLELERQQELMRAVNETAAALLESNAEDYLNAINRSMEMICRSLYVDRVYLWQNERKADGKRYCRQICKWAREEKTTDEQPEEFAFQDALPSWESLLAQGRLINGPLETVPDGKRPLLTDANIQSILAAPLFFKGEFWGFVSFDDCTARRFFTQAEENVLRSWGLLVVGAIQRGEIERERQHTLTKLETIIVNYKGIIWSVNRDRTVTAFNGTYLENLGITPVFAEGKKLEEVRIENKDFNIIENVEKTFLEGSQDWISDVDGAVLHSYTTPYFDNNNTILGVIGSTDDVTEMVKLQRELKTAVAAAQTASLSKSKFLANMSHEMRTPLNAIIGLAEIELASETLEGDSFVNVEKMYSAGMNLLGIINDILDISKIESGQFALIPIEYDVGSMINDTVNLNIVRIGSKPIQFNLRVDGSLPSRLEGDELRVKQIFNNLLSNAIKYTESGSVDWTISCERDGERVRIISSVRDTGLGISAEDQKKLFKDYFQTDLKTNYHTEGTGLGLSITQNMVQLMDGSITLKSVYREGSEFTVEFCQKMVGEGIIGAEAAENLSQFRFTAQRRSRNQKLIRLDMSYATVLVVDDVITNLDVAKGMLKPYKLRVDCVTSGQAAIDRIREAKIRYSAIFMDHMMPGMDGIEAVRVIRHEINTEYARTIPIIALTANAIMGNDIMFLRNGFQAFLSKPIDILRLDHVLRQWVRDSTKERELPAERGEDTNGEEAGNSGALVIPGIDVKTALARFGNDAESYLRILASFAAHTPAFIETARTATNDLATFRIAVHGIKGSSRSIGAEAIGAMAEKLEHAAREEDSAFVEANTAAFIDAARNLIATVTDFLNKRNNEPNETKPKHNAPDP